MARPSTMLLLCGLFLVPLSGALSLRRHATVINERQVSSSYHFVIAGGGIAGLTLADRLTEDPNVQVLVIEAGPLDQGEDAILVPGAWNPSAYIWPGLVLEPQQALNGRTFASVVARVAGGGSTINAMNYLRGTITDYDGWESLGNPGWGWSDMLPYFKKSENFTAPSPAFAAANNISWDPSLRGTGGPVQYSYPNFIYPGTAAWTAAAKAIGIPKLVDPLSGKNAGFFNQPVAIDANRAWTRSHARRNHYDRVSATRPNFHLLVNNHVAKVLFSSGGGGITPTATGVSYLPSAGGSLSTVLATKEVILAAGALHTPQILQLSGIGPKAALAALGIPLLVNLPGVGQNLQEQYSLQIPYTFTNGITPNVTTFLGDAAYAAQQRALYDAGSPSVYTVCRYLGNHFGFLSLRDATGGSTSSAAYTRILSDARARDPALSLPSDADATVLAGYAAQRRVVLSQFADADTAVGSVNWDSGNGGQLFQLKPLSRGNLSLVSTDPLAAPRIDYRAATDPTDLAVLAQLFRRQRALAASAPFAALGPVEQAPFGAGVVTDEQIIAVARDNMAPGSSHQCCTAPMMPRAKGGVLSPKMKVYGTNRLRVVDVSYWPFELSGPPTATMYATGEKVADMIKDEYHLDGH